MRINLVDSGVVSFILAGSGVLHADNEPKPAPEAENANAPQPPSAAAPPPARRKNRPY